MTLKRGFSLMTMPWREFFANCVPSRPSGHKRFAVCWLGHYLLFLNRSVFMYESYGWRQWLARQFSKDGCVSIVQYVAAVYLCRLQSPSCWRQVDTAMRWCPFAGLQGVIPAPIWDHQTTGVTHVRSVFVVMIVLWTTDQSWFDCRQGLLSSPKRPDRPWCPQPPI